MKTKTNMIGYIGLAFLCFAYLLLLTRFDKFFIYFNIVGTSLLTIYAVMLGDIPFMVANGLIDVILITKLIKNKRIL